MSEMTERYEAEAEAFYKATGVMAPGKDSPAAMGYYDADELRHKLWRMWARAVYAERERDEARRERDVALIDAEMAQRYAEKIRHRAERAERDGVLLNFLADDPPFDGFYDMDLYETWGEVAAKYGREEPNDDDKREAFRLLLSRALDAAERPNA